MKMFSGMRLWKLTALAVFALVILFFQRVDADPADSLDLSAWLGNAIVYPDQEEIAIPLHLANYNDTVAAFSFLIRMDQPHLASFQPEVDTSGTVLAGWSIMLNQYNDYTMRVTGILSPGAPPGAVNLPPQDGQSEIMRLYVDALPMDDTVTISIDRLDFLTSPTENFIVSDPLGTVIGMIYDTLVDTNYYVCNTFAGPDCIDSTQVPPGALYDFFHISTKEVPTLDTSRVSISSGELIIVRCGNFDGSIDNRINLADITAQIAFVYLGGDSPALEWSANVDGSPDGRVNLADITKLISHVYIDHVLLTCQ